MAGEGHFQQRGEQPAVGAVVIGQKQAGARAARQRRGEARPAGSDHPGRRAPRRAEPYTCASAEAPEAISPAAQIDAATATLAPGQ